MNISLFVMYCILLFVLYVYSRICISQPPRITSLSPIIGVYNTTTVITINGQYFADSTTNIDYITIGGTGIEYNCSNIQWWSHTLITCMVPLALPLASQNKIIVSILGSAS